MAKASKSKKKKKVVPMALHCSVCNSQNYHIRKKVKAEYKFTEEEPLMKYCPQCQKHTPHIEKKIPKNN